MVFCVNRRDDEYNFFNNKAFFTVIYNFYISLKASSLKTTLKSSQLIYLYKTFLYQSLFLTMKTFSTFITTKTIFTDSLKMQKITNYQITSSHVAVNFNFPFPLLSLSQTLKKNNKNYSKKIIYRTMMLGRSLPMARAAFHFYKAITDRDVLNDTSKNDKKPIINSLVALSLNHTTGTIQHKSAFMNATISDKFQGDLFYKAFSEITGIEKISFVQGNTDLRLIKELSVLELFYRSFEEDIIDIQVNLDNVPGNFPAQVQTNQDFHVTIKSMFNHVMKPLSFVTPNNEIIVRPHDEKSGMGMFKHATRGTLGLLTYDNTNNTNVQTMSQAISITDLIKKDKHHLYSVTEGLTQDGLYDARIHIPLIEKATAILNHPANSFEENLNIHQNYQQFMWEHFHQNPNYLRSISFIFALGVDYNHTAEQDPKFLNFKNKIVSLLGDKIYNLDKPSDCREVSIAMVVAYKNTVDPQILDKLQHLQHVANITFNARFLQDLAYMIKKGLI